MALTLAPQEPFLVAEWRKPPGFSRVFSHNTGRPAPYRYLSERHWALALGLNRLAMSHDTLDPDEHLQFSGSVLGRLLRGSETPPCNPILQNELNHARHHH